VEGARLGRPCGPGPLRAIREDRLAAAVPFPQFTCPRGRGEDGPVDPAGVAATAGATGGPTRPRRPSSSKPRCRRRPSGPPAGFGCWPSRVGRRGAARSAGARWTSWATSSNRRVVAASVAAAWGSACSWCRSGRGRRPEAGRSPPGSSRRRCAAGTASGVWECAKVSECFSERSANPRLGDGVVVSARCDAPRCHPRERWE
jgi:hypothetical protein